MIAVLYASHNNEKVRAVTTLLERQGIPFKVYGLDDNWQGYGVKLRTAFQASVELVDHEHILFLDAHDIIALAGPDAIMERFRTFNHPWVCNAEPNIWPIRSFQPEDYPPCDSRWLYLNSGAYLVERQYLRECFERWAGTPEAISFGWDDQRYLADKYLSEPGCIKLDTECELFQCLIGGWWAFEIEPGRFYNKETGTEPLILHHNGGGDITEERIYKVWHK